MYTLIINCPGYQISRYISDYKGKRNIIHVHFEYKILPAEFCTNTMIYDRIACRTHTVSPLKKTGTVHYGASY